VPVPIDEPCSWVDPPAVRRARRAERARFAPIEETHSLGLGSSLNSGIEIGELDPKEKLAAWRLRKKEEKLCRK
jgi:hypothetical protein